MTLRVLDLFAGIGGFSLGLERAGGFQIAAMCEIDPFCRRVLAKHWPEVPIYEDVRDLGAARLRSDGVGRIDVVTGGYPCQPFSHAGRRSGTDDPRHLWPAMRRLVGEVRPSWVVAENVVGHITLGLDQVLADLEADGYACRAIAVPAAAVDAPHIRQRVWILARDTDRDREPAMPVDAEVEGVRGDMADADGERLQVGIDERRAEGETRIAPARRKAGEPRRWLPEPGVGRVATGIPHRVDRLRALGNSVVPQVVEMIGRAIVRAA
jgi:DNA (cytosine-5)-methyltransferase 1